MSTARSGRQTVAGSLNGDAPCRWRLEDVAGVMPYHDDGLVGTWINRLRAAAVAEVRGGV